MNLVITGALGHIGSAFIHRMRPAEWDRIVLLDNLSTQRYCALFNLPKGVPFEFVEGDVRSADLIRVFDGADVVVHLAAVTNAEQSVAIADEVERVNCGGTARVAEACLATGARLLFVSTTSVYGPQSARVDEMCDSSELRPQSPYAFSKLRAEQELAGLGERGLRYMVARFGTVFGVSPGMRFHTAINKFCWQASMGEAVSVWRTAMYQERPYLNIRDAVSGIEFVIRRDLFDRGTYNIVTTNATVRDILAIINKDAPSMRVEYVDSPIMNQLSYAVSSGRFRGKGFSFCGKLQVGIHETMRLLSPMHAARPSENKNMLGRKYQAK